MDDPETELNTELSNEGLAKINDEFRISVINGFYLEFLLLL
jgi:hypothetical protein